MEQEKVIVVEQKKKHNLLFISSIISLALWILVGGTFLLYFKFRPDNKNNQTHWFEIEEVQDFVTLEAIHHVVVVDDEAGNWLTIGEKYIWYEFDASVEAGIDINKMKIYQSSDSNVVKIYMPEAEIFAVKDLDSTISNPVADTGFLTELTIEERNSIIDEKLNEMKSSPQLEEVKKAARDRAIKLVENHVIKTGEAIGKTYTVEWVDKAEDSPTVSAETKTENSN